MKRTYISLVVLFLCSLPNISVFGQACPFTAAQFVSGGQTVASSCSLDVGGGITVTGTNTINAGVTLTVTNGYVDINGGTLNVNGTMDITNPFFETWIYGGGTLNVGSAGTYNVALSIQFWNPSSANISGTFTSGSQIDIDAGATVTVNSGGTMNTGSTFDDLLVQGTLNVAGTVNALDDLDNDGTINVLSGGVINSSDQFTGSGTTNINSGATVNAATVRVQNSEFNVDGTFNISTELRMGGTTVPPGGTVNVGSSGCLDVDGDINLGPDGSSNVGLLDLNGKATVGGQFDINNSGSFLTSSGGSGSLLLESNPISFENGAVEGTNAPLFPSCAVGVACGPGALPVELIHFSGIYENGHAVLKWSTASELNNEGFDIETSVDGEFWETIGFVTGHGTTNERQHYGFTDQNLLQSSYYRLKQKDFDGAFEYSPFVFVSVVGDDLENAIILYPNPVRTTITLDGLQEEIYTVSLNDLSGRTLMIPDKMNLLQAQSLLNQILPRLESGSYILKFQNPALSITHNIIKLN